MPFYQSALGDRLDYELKFNDYSHVIQVTGNVDASYHIGGISLEYDMVTLAELAQMITTTLLSQHYALLQPSNNESGGHHRGDPQPTLKSRDARLSDVGRGKEVLCGITRQ